MKKYIEKMIFGIVEGRKERMEVILKNQDLKAYLKEMKGHEGHCSDIGYLTNKNGTLTINGVVFTPGNVLKLYSVPSKT